MKAIVVARVREIRRLHEEIGEALRTTLPKAIRVGELLAEQKAEMKHGEWLPWCKDNLPFTDRTARNYMQFYDHRGQLKSELVSDLPTARKLITVSKKPKKGRIPATAPELAAPVVPMVGQEEERIISELRAMTFRHRLRIVARILIGR
jgi:hypothetical protein